MKSVYVTAYSTIENNVRGCIINLPADYDYESDLGVGGVGAFKHLRQLFEESVKSQCTCRAAYEKYKADSIKITGIMLTTLNF